MFDMGIEVKWRSQKGNRTQDNRDYCGVAIRPEATLCLVVDGATTGSNGGELAQTFSHELVDWFVSADVIISAETIIGAIGSIHKNISRQFPFDSASYVIVLIQDEGPFLILHAGDCLIGHCDEENNSVQWLIKPHTLANAIKDMSVALILKSPARHVLTRSFRPKVFITPQISEIGMNIGDLFVVATDGYWADLGSEEQIDFMEDRDIATMGESDDQSVLRLRVLGHQIDTQSLTDENNLNNFYMKTFDDCCL